MSWVKIDDGLSEHPKITWAGPLALAAFISGLCYAARQLTDGFIPASVADTIAHGATRKRLETCAPNRRFPLWETVTGGYQIHDYLQYNPSRAEVLALREKKRLAGQTGGQTRAKHATRQVSGRFAGRLVGNYPKQKPAPDPVPRSTTEGKGSEGIPEPRPAPQPPAGAPTAIPPAAPSGQAHIRSPYSSNDSPSPQVLADQAKRRIDQAAAQPDQDDDDVP